MTPSSIRCRTYSRRRWGGAGFFVLIALLLCATGQPQSAPVQGAGLPDGAGVQAGTLPSEGAALAPFLNIVPTSDGDLWIHAEGTGPLGGVVYANTEIGPGHHKGGWTMIYSDTLRGYVNVETVVGFSPAQDDFGSLSITTTHGLDSGAIHFERYYVPLATPRTLVWPDGAIELDIPSGDTFPTDTYLAAAPSWGLPRPAPLGHQLAGAVYSLRASGAQQEAARPMILRFYLQKELPDGADPHTLAVLGWDAQEKVWKRLEGTLFADRGYVSTSIRRLTSYALMATPVWLDTFNDHTGLSGWSGVAWGGSVDDLALVLAGGAQTGHALSVPISALPAGSSETPPVRSWDRLRYDAASDPPTTTLTVDLLRPDGTLVWSDVPSGADLGGLDTEQYPALALRATLASTVAGQSPALYGWQLSWEAPAHTAYLPLVRNGR